MLVEKYPRYSGKPDPGLRKRVHAAGFESPNGLSDVESRSAIAEPG